MSTPSTDSAAIKQILNGLTEAGYTITHVDNGEDDDIPANSTAEALEEVMQVDEAYVHLLTPTGNEGWVWFVLGNEPFEVAANYTTNLDPHLSAITDKWDW